MKKLPAVLLFIGFAAFVLLGLLGQLELLPESAEEWATAALLVIGGGLLIGMYCCWPRLLAWAFGRNHRQEEPGDGELLK